MITVSSVKTIAKKYVGVVGRIMVVLLLDDFSVDAVSVQSIKCCHINESHVESSVRLSV